MKMALWLFPNHTVARELSHEVLLTLLDNLLMAISVHTVDR